MKVGVLVMCFVAVVTVAVVTPQVTGSTFSRADALTTTGADFFAGGYNPTTRRAYFVSYEAGATVVEVDTVSGTILQTVTVATISTAQTACVDHISSPPALIVGTIGGSVHRVRLDTMVQTGEFTVSGGDDLYSIAFDSEWQKAFITSTTRIYTVDTTSGGFAEERAFVSNDFAFTSMYDEDRKILFLPTRNKPSKVAPYNTFNGAVQGAVAAFSGSLLLESGEDFMSASIYNPVTQMGYVATDSSNNFVVELDLSAAQGTVVRTGRRILTGGSGIRSAVLDPNTGLQYWGANSIPSGFVYLINSTSMELVETLTLPQEEKRLTSAAIDPDANAMYFGTQSDPGLVIAVNAASCPNNCNAAAGGGTCNPATNLCECNTLRDGFDCSIILCVDNCNGPDRGICNQGVCFCNANYTGDLCQFRTCLGGCGEEVNHGSCDDGTCICVSDDVGSWNGPTCDTFSVNCVPRDCSGHGVCPISLSSECECDSGWDFSPFCDISDADAAALTIQLELSSPYNRTEFVDAIVYELGILEECLFILKEPETDPDTGDSIPPYIVIFTLLSCPQPANSTSEQLVQRLTDVLSGRVPPKTRPGESDSALGRIGVPLRSKAPDADSSGATGALIGIAVAVVVIFALGFGAYFLIKRKLLADARAKREGGEDFDNMELAEHDFDQ